jgi:hypothetical protein
MSSSVTSIEPARYAVEPTLLSTAPDTHQHGPAVVLRASQAVTEQIHNDATSNTVEQRGQGLAESLSGLSITLTMTSLCLSVTLSALDMTIVTTAVPSIVASLKSSAGYVWVGSAFILGFTAVTPIWGSVADLWGRRPIILIALAVFLVGSLLCALAPHMDALIAGRTVQGIGASGMGVMVNTIICDMFSLRDRGL